MINNETGFSAHSRIMELTAQILDSGGPVMMILLMMSIIGSSVIVMKLIQFYFVQIGRFKAINRAIELFSQDQPVQAKEMTSKTRNPAGQVVHAVINGIEKQADIELVREEAQRLASRSIESLHSHLRIIEIIATLAPLLGLLGTVLGIIDAFHQLELAGNNVDVSQLSGGIWVALLTTAAGLSVGIPAVIALNWLEARIESYTNRTEDAVTRLFTQPLFQQQAFEGETCNSTVTANQGA